MKTRNTPTSPVALVGEILTDVQAAQFLTVELRTLRDWRHRLGLPHIKITSREIRYRRSDLNAWLAKFRTVIS